MRIILVLVLWFASVAAAYPRGVHPPGPMHEWFASQYAAGIPNWPESKMADAWHHPGKQWCCDVSDGYILDDDDWERRGKRYWVHIEGKWYPVAEGAELDPKGGPNPTGHAVVWYNKTVDELGDYWIYCFAPGDLY